MIRKEKSSPNWQLQWHRVAMNRILIFKKRIDSLDIVDFELH
ncbi:unnamed protein product [Acidithrix sp. C25]|nr:unnamed protein product [Acidithrix sp. C25]